MSQDKTKEEILSEVTGQEGIYLTKGLIQGSDALEAMETYAQHQLSEAKGDVELYKLRNENLIENYQILQSQLEEAKGEIERLKEDNEQYAEEHEKSCNVTHNLHLLANDKRAEVIKLQSLLTQKDKEIAELKEIVILLCDL